MMKKALRVVVGATALLAARRLLARSYSLDGKVVMVTGGSRGLGLLIARELAERGAHLVLCARDGDALERAREDLAGRGAEVLVVPCDVGDPDQVDNLVARVRERFGRIDAVVNNAGVIQVGPLETMDRADYEEAMRVHFWGPLNVTLALLPEMRERREGRIVNITSIGGKVSIPHLLPYAASKFALVGLSEGLRAELAREGVCVTTVVPGLMRTGSPRNAFFKGRHRAEYAWFKLGGSLPAVSIDAERAARRIVQALERGEAEAILSAPAKLATWFHGLFPGLTVELLGLVNRLLPRAGGIGSERALGKDSEGVLTKSWLTSLTEKAAVQNNEA